MQREFIEKYDLGSVLGTGAFSEVRLGTCKRSGEKYAIKIIDRSKCKGKEEMIDTEVKILQKINHPNIVKLYDKFEFDGKIYLIMELVTGGELFDEIVGRGSIPEREAAHIVEKILHAINYLHRKGIVHRDLKPENLLLSEKSGDATVKISDFGLSKIFNDEVIMKTACGTPGYVAPEVLRRQGYSKEVDMWSLGVITYILLCGYPPFYDQKNAELFKKIMAGKYQFDHPWWDHISERAKDFVRRLLVVDTYKRFTAAEALEHPFITQLRPVTIPRPLEENLADTFENLHMKSIQKKNDTAELTASIDTVVTSGHTSHKTKESLSPTQPLSFRHIDPKEKVKSIFTAKVHRLASWIKGSHKKV